MESEHWHREMQTCYALARTPTALNNIAQGKRSAGLGSAARK
jgi:hypothetical protein